MSAFYNEFDNYPARWLRNLIDAGHIAPGIVDERSITDLEPEDIPDGQAHFFAGIGVWSHALRLAGWSDDAPVWTGSCPCQPFSAAGKRGGHVDERHLWPAWFRLIRERRPPVVFGEQVAGKAGLAWLDAVRADMESAGYAVGAANLCAASAGAPHIRQRLFFVAFAGGAEWGAWRAGCGGASGAGPHGQPSGPSDTGLVADSTCGGTPAGELGGRIRGPVEGGNSSELADADGGLSGHRGLQRGGELGLQPKDGGAMRLADAEGGNRGLPVRQRRSEQEVAEPRGRGETGDVEHAAGDGRGERRTEPSGRRAASGCGDGDVADPERERGRSGEPREQDAADAREPGPARGWWSDARWVWCRDGFWRPHGPEPGALPLVDGAAFRVGSGSAYEGQSRAAMLRGYGNAIVAPLAAEFVAAAMECMASKREVKGA